MNAMGTNIAVTTFSFVSGPLGISIMALLENIEKFAQLPQYRGVGDIAILDPNPPFATRQIPGRGAALVAVRDIAFGQLIMHEAPIFMRDEEFHSKLSTADCVKFTLEAVHQLPAETQAVFFNLHQQGIGEEVEDIISTNSFKVRIGEGSDQRTYAAVVPGIAVSSSSIGEPCRVLD